MNQIKDYTEKTTPASTDEYILQETSGGITKKITHENFLKIIQAEVDAAAALTGNIAAFAGSSTPTGYLLCDGSAVSRTTYADLFTAIGTTWGVGDGSTTFNIPDLRGAFLRGTGSHGTENMANGNDFAGPALGSFENDQAQSFGLASGDSAGGSVVNIGEATCNVFAGTSHAQDSYKTLSGSGVGLIGNDGTNGQPRTGDETRPFNAGVNYIIKAV